MVVAGIPEPAADHAHRLCGFALAVREEFARFVSNRGLDINIRIGAHSGTAVAGVSEPKNPPKTSGAMSSMWPVAWNQVAASAKYTF